MQLTTTTATPNPGDRPLDFILGDPAITNAIVEGMIAGRVETQNRFTTETPSFHRGLFAFVVCNDAIGTGLVSLEWFRQLRRNQLRWAAPETLSPHRVRLVIMSGKFERDHFRVNHKGDTTRELADGQEEPVDGGQLSLFGQPGQPHSVCKSVFVISQNEKFVEEGEWRDILSLFLVYPRRLSACGTMVEFDDYELLTSVDLNNLNTNAASVPSSVLIEPEIEEIDEVDPGDDAGQHFGMTG